MEIGGFFPYQPVDSEPNNYVEHTCPDPGDTAHQCPAVVPFITV